MNKMFRTSPNHNPLTRTALALILFLLLLFRPQAAVDSTLRISLPSGETVLCSISHFGEVRYVALQQVTMALRQIDAQARLQWDATTGVYDIQAAGKQFTVYSRKNLLLYNNTLIETSSHLRVVRGKPFVPLETLLIILQRFEGISTNHSLQSLTPTQNTTSYDPSLELEQVPDLQQIADWFAADPRTEHKGSLDVLGEQLKKSAIGMRQQQLILIDPQPLDQLRVVDDQSPESNMVLRDGSDLTWRIAQRCRSILATHPMLRVELTRREDEAATPDKRLAHANGAYGQALICLRLDASRFVDQKGYRLFVANRSVDPAANNKNKSALPANAPERSYEPYQQMSLILARLLDSQMQQSGYARASAQESPVLAPVYMLKRAAMPSVCLTLGYATNGVDLEQIEQQDYIEHVARGLAQSILKFDAWMQKQSIVDSAQGTP